MFYTSYFAKLKSIPKDIVPISICAKAPDWYDGLQYKRLAPTYDVLMRYKGNGDTEEFERDYTIQVLNKLDMDDVAEELADLAYGINPDFRKVCLVCFEKSDDFCHRHVVAKALKKAGYLCEEL